MQGLIRTTQTTLMWPKTFRESFCERFSCPPENFEKRVFWRCLYRRSLPLAWLASLLHRHHFDLDMQTIRQLGVCRSPQEFRAELESFRYEYRTRGGLLRRLRVRVSGKRLIGLLAEIGQPLESSKEKLAKTS
jgi:hypothetical protein